MHILPSQFLEFDDAEKAFIVAAIKVKIDNDKKKEKELAKKKPKKGKKGR